MNMMGTHRFHRRFTAVCALLLAVILLHSHAFAANLAGTDTVTVVASGADDTLTAVYAYGGYKISLRNAVFSDNGKDDGKMLTDRKYTTAKPKSDREKTEGWVMIESYDGESDYRATITVDFGFIAKNTVRFYLRAFRSTELGAEMPQRIRFYSSTDGEDFTLLGEGGTMTDVTVDNSAAVYYYTIDEGVDVRYMRVIIDCAGGNTLWLNEVGAAAKANVLRVNDDANGVIRDSRGLQYRIDGGAATVVSADSIPAGDYANIKPSDASFDTDGIEYTLGKGSGNEVKVISDFIGEGRPNYSGVPNNIQYIIIHNTGTTEEDTDAVRYNHRMHSTTEETSWHYTVDENIIYHSLADSVVGWHAGSSHNYESIGIEICTNGAPKRSSGALVFSGSTYDNWVETRFKKSLRNTAVLVAELLTRYGLSTDAVIQHYDVTEKNCPLWLREKNGKFVYEGTLWLEFMSYVEEYYQMLNGASPTPIIRPDGEYIIPDYVTTNDGEVYPVKTVGDGAFAEIPEGIEHLRLGLMLEDIAVNAFDGTVTERITVCDGNKNFYVEDGVLFSADGTVIYDKNDVAVLEPTPKEGCTLDIRSIDGRHYLFLKDCEHTLEYIANEYGANEYRASALNGSAISRNSGVSTGAVIILDGVRLYTVVRGDANGDAVIDQYDYILVKRTYFGTYSPLRRQYYAMTVSGAEEVCVFDYILIKRHVFGTYDITE